MLRRTPFYEQHVALGGKMVPFAGFELPVQYPQGITVEHNAVRTAAGLFDVSHMGELRVKGTGAAAQLSQLLSGDIVDMAIGDASYHMLLNKDGGVVDDVYAYRLAKDDFLVCVNAANRDKDREWFEANWTHDDAQLTDEGDDWAQLAIQGPKAVDVMAYLCGEAIREQADRTFTERFVGAASNVLVARTGYTGEDGFELFIPAAQAQAVWDAIQTVAPATGLVSCGLGARDTLRLEARNCLYGHELNDETTPWQAGLGWAIKMDKEGGFIGRDALAAKKGQATERLVGIVVTDKRIPRDDMDIYVGDERIGHVTSGTRSPSTGKGIALAYVGRGFGRPGTEVEIDVRGKRAAAVVHKGSFTTL
jgi:aminomethyltransferase